MIRDILKFALILVVVAAVVGGGVAALYGVLHDRISGRELEQKEAAIRDVAPAGATVDVGQPIAGEPFTPDAVYAATADGRAVAYIASGAAVGYSSTVEVMVGVRAEDLSIVRVVVVKQQETPGLGANVQELKSNYTFWEKLFGPSEGGKTEQLVNPFLSRFKGKTAGEVPGIDAITAATITSNATKAAVLQAIERIRKAIGRS